MWASTLWPLASSTRNIAFGKASTTLPSISMTPSFFAISSANSLMDEPGHVGHDETTRAFRGFVQGHDPRRAASATGPITGARPHRAHTPNGRFYAIAGLGRNRTRYARAARGRRTVSHVDAQTPTPTGIHAPGRRRDHRGAMPVPVVVR